MVHSGDTDFGVDLGAYSYGETLMSDHAVKMAAEDASGRCSRRFRSSWA